MLRLAGALSSFSPEANLGDLPDYDHDNLGPCFTELDARLRDLLETVLPTKCVVIQLESAGKLIWSGTITDDRYLRNSQCYLAVSARIAIDELIGKFPRLAKLSSPVEIDRLVQRSLPGVSLRHTPAPPPAVPVKMDHQYFSLGQSGALWEGVTQSRTINVFVPGEIASPKLELVIVLP
jgi:type VI secretion system protein ImpJ